MKRLIVVSNFWPTQGNSISGIFVAQQVGALCEQGVHVTVVACRYTLKRDRHLSPAELGLPEQVSLHSAPIFRMPESFSRNKIGLKLNAVAAKISIASAISKSLESGIEADGCIVHGIRYCGVTVPYWADRIAGKTLLFIHGVDPFLREPPVARWLRECAPAINEKIEKFVLVGSPLKEYLSNTGLDIRKSVIIPNGTDLSAAEDENKHGFNNEGKCLIVSVSNLTSIKGVDDNIMALYILKNELEVLNWRYDIIGDGPERQRLEDMVDRLDMRDQVYFHGRLPYSDTMEAISRADIFSLPSWKEAFGIVYLEAMARCKATIGCLENGAADIITSGEDGLLVPPKDPGALALALRRLLDDGKLRLELGACGRATAERFGWDVNACRVLEALGICVSPAAASDAKMGEGYGSLSKAGG